MVIHRGEIWWANLPSPSGSEPGYAHPVVVVQSDDFNRSLIETVVAVVVTTNLRLAQTPGNILLLRKHSKLPKDSVINGSQIVTLDKSLLTERVGKLTPAQLEEVEEGVRLVLDLV